MELSLPRFFSAEPAAAKREVLKLEATATRMLSIFFDAVSLARDELIRVL
jgi:hypothetical protein